jgi:hypothetical protein
MAPRIKAGHGTNASGLASARLAAMARRAAGPRRQGDQNDRDVPGGTQVHVHGVGGGIRRVTSHERLVADGSMPLRFTTPHRGARPGVSHALPVDGLLVSHVAGGASPGVEGRVVHEQPGRERV